MGAPARLNFPGGVASDRAGNLYITDYNAVRAVDIATGAVTTIAGVVDQSGAADGTGAAAGSSTPTESPATGRAISTSPIPAMRPSGKGRHRDRRRHHGRGPGGRGRDWPVRVLRLRRRDRRGRPLLQPGRHRSDGAGNLYVADSGSRTIRKIVIATGAVTTLAGSAGAATAPGPTAAGADARFNTPIGIASDGARQPLRRRTGSNTHPQGRIATGVVTTLAGTGTDSAGGADGDRRARPLLRAIRHRQRRARATSTSPTRTTTPSARSSSPPAPSPRSRATPGHGRLQRRRDGRRAPASAHPSASPATAPAISTSPTANNHSIRQVVIATGARHHGRGQRDGADIADGTVAPPARVSTTRWASPATARTTSTSPTRQQRHPQGRHRDRRRHHHRRAPGRLGSADGTGGRRRASTTPTASPATASGNLYVADTGNHTIRKIALATGVVTTLAGTAGQFRRRRRRPARRRASTARPASPATGAATSTSPTPATSTIRKIVDRDRRRHHPRRRGGTPGSADGTGTAARFIYPYGVACDAAATSTSPTPATSTIRKIVVATGAVTTLAGKAGRPAPPTARTGARFTCPMRHRRRRRRALRRRHRQQHRPDGLDRGGVRVHRDPRRGPGVAQCPLWPRPPANGRARHHRLRPEHRPDRAPVKRGSVMRNRCLIVLSTFGLLACAGKRLNVGDDGAGGGFAGSGGGLAGVGGGFAGSGGGLAGVGGGLAGSGGQAGVAAGAAGLIMPSGTGGTTSAGGTGGSGGATGTGGATGQAVLPDHRVDLSGRWPGRAGSACRWNGRGRPFQLPGTHRQRRRRQRRGRQQQRRHRQGRRRDRDRHHAGG